MEIYFPENLYTEFENHARNGILVKKRFFTWSSKIVHKTRGKQKLFFQPSCTVKKYEINKKVICSKVVRLFNFYGHKTLIGYFFPEKNLIFYRKEIIEIENQFQKFKEEISSGYKDIYKDLKRKYTEIVYFIWTNELKNPGNPPEIFIEQFCKEKIEEKCSLEKILQKNCFKAININPFIEENRTSYGTGEEIKKHNREVVEYLYRGVIMKRRMLAYFLIAKNNAIKSNKFSYKSVASFLYMWKNCVFYSDSVLIEKIDVLRNAIMMNIERDKEKISPIIEEIIDYLLNHKDYQLGVLYEKKRKES